MFYFLRLETMGKKLKRKINFMQVFKISKGFVRKDFLVHIKTN